MVFEMHKIQTIFVGIPLLLLVGIAQASVYTASQCPSNGTVLASCSTDSNGVLSCRNIGHGWRLGLVTTPKNAKTLNIANIPMSFSKAWIKDDYGNCTYQSNSGSYFVTYVTIEHHNADTLASPKGAWKDKVCRLSQSECKMGYNATPSRSGGAQLE